MSDEAAAVRHIPVPEGLCGNKADHEPHLVTWAAVANGPFWCHAVQARRVPYAIEQRQKLKLDYAARRARAVDELAAMLP